MKEIIENERLIELLSIDLDSGSIITRLAAIMHFQTLISSSRVQNILFKHLVKEEDPECYTILQQMLENPDASEEVAFSPDPGTFLNLSGFDKLFKQFLDIPQAKIAEFTQELLQITPHKIQRFLLVVFTRDSRIEAIKELLINLNKTLKNFDFQKTVSALLTSGTSISILRVFPVLVEICPEIALPKLPSLLVHNSLVVRVYAIRLLYKLFPEEAIRLLGNLVFHSKMEIRGIGIGLTVTFPFPEVKKLIVTALEEAVIPADKMPLLVEITRNNPDKTFLDDLAWIYARFGTETSNVMKMMRAVSESIALVGMEPGTPGRIMGESIQNARNKLTETTWWKNKKDEKGGSTDQEDFLESFLESFSLGGRSEKKFHSESGELNEDLPISKLISRLPSQPDKDFMISLGRWMIKNNPRDRKLMNWLVLQLESSDVKVVVLSVELMGRFYSRSLLPHLPMLSFHIDFMVVNQAIRQFRRLDESMLVQNIKNWINQSRDNNSIRAALTGLVQMRFSCAKSLLLTTLESVSEPELLESFGSILVMNPDREVAVRLRIMAGKTISEKGVFLRRLAADVENGLKIMNLSTDGIMQKLLSVSQLENLLDEISKINFLNSDFSGHFSGLSKQLKTMGIGIILIVVFVLGFQQIFGSNVPPNSSKLSTPGSMRKPLAEEIKKGVILDYDNENRLWLFRTDEDLIFQIIIPVEHKVAKGNRLQIKLQDSGKTVGGVLLFSAREVVFLQPNSP